MIPVTVILLALRKVEAGVNNFCGTKFLSETWVLGAPTTIFFLITSFIGERGKPPNNPYASFYTDGIWISYQRHKLEVKKIAILTITTFNKTKQL